MAKFRKKTRAVFTLLALWLLLCAPTTPFFSERHQTLRRRPTSSWDVISSQYYFCVDQHINSTLSRTDVTRWMQPAQIITTVVSVACVLAVMAMVVYLLALLGFCGCHFAVQWAISGRQIPRPQVYTEAPRYNNMLY